MLSQPPPSEIAISGTWGHRRVIFCANIQLSNGAKDVGDWAVSVAGFEGSFEAYLAQQIDSVLTILAAPSVEQEEKLGKVVVKYEAAIKEVDVRLSATGGDAGKGAKKQKTEITIYTLRNGIVSLSAPLMCMCCQNKRHGGGALHVLNVLPLG